MKYSKKIFSIVGIVTLSLMAFNFSYAQSGNVRIGRVLTTTQNKVLFITQSVQTNFQVTYKGRIGSPTSTVANPNFSMDARAIPLAASDFNVLNLLPVDVNYRNATASTPLKTADQVRAAAQLWIGSNRDALVDRFRVGGSTSYMEKFGVGSVWFNYSQKVKVADPVRSSGEKEVTLFWSMSLDRKGQPLFSAVQMLEDSPLLMQAIYSSKSLAQGLPADWVNIFTDRNKAGFLSYRFLDLQGAPVGSWTSVDYQGVFDEPPESENSNVDADIGLKCLINNQSIGACTPAMQAKKDIKTILAESGAITAFLTYSRNIEPLYNQVPIPNTNPVQYESVAKISLQIDSRTVSRSGDCDHLEYKNKGAYGYTLVDKADLYVVQPSGVYQIIGSAPDRQMVVPADKYHPFETIRIVDQSQYDNGSLGGLIINPEDQPGAMLSVAVLQANSGAVDQPSLIMGPDSAVSFLAGNSFVAGIGLGQADMEVHYDAIPEQPGWSRLTFGKGGGNYWGGNTSTGAVYDRSFTFSLTKSHIKQFFIDSISIDDYLGVKVNGVMAHVFPYGGDRLEQVCTPVYYQDCNYTYPDDNGNGGGEVCQQVLWYNNCQIQFGENWFRNAENYGNDGNQSGLYVNILPYLQDGTNTIQSRTIVAGTGKSFFSMKVEACN